MPIAFSHGTLPHPLQPDVSLCLYRIAQEALHNIARHSRAPEAQVLLSPVDRHISLDITDSGVGFDPQAQYALSLFGEAESLTRLTAAGRQAKADDK